MKKITGTFRYSRRKYFFTSRKKKLEICNLKKFRFIFWDYCRIVFSRRLRGSEANRKKRGRDWTPGRIGMYGFHTVKAWESTTFDCTTSAVAALRFSLVRFAYSAPPLAVRSAFERKNLVILFYEKNPFKRNFWKYQNFAQKIWEVINFTKEIPFNEIFENPKIVQKKSLTEDPILLHTKFRKIRCP